MRAAYVLALAFALSACAGRPEGNLIAVEAHVAGASTVDMLVATTRAPVDAPEGVMFGGERGRGLRFADISVSIPPDAVRKIGDVQWPARPPGDPARDFVTLRADRLELKEAKAVFHQRILANRGRHALVFVHGYNTRFEEAVYRFAQIAHDSGADVVPVLFTWPSRGKALEYLYDRESANYSRDGLEAVLQALADDPSVSDVSILAHSLGNYVAVEALRQMSIRDRGLPAKIRDIMLASPDIDVDVFRRQIAEIENGHKPAPITLFVAQDDKALGLSQLIAGDEPRLGAVDPTREPYRGLLQQAGVRVVDLTALETDDPAHHSKFASADVVRAIGVRLAQGQALTDAKSNLGETIGAMAINATHAVGTVAAVAATAPFDSDGRQTADLRGPANNPRGGHAYSSPDFNNR
jgi:esterase/lipase superfamily enzyme